MSTMIFTTYQIIDKISLQTNFSLSKYIVYDDTTLSPISRYGICKSKIV